MTQPFFFGQSDSKLFGFSHPPLKQSKNIAILLCYPLGQEYLRVYRSYKLLANRLSASGAHVLRFDYFGTGDSDGRSEECDLEHWLRDINVAIEELKTKSGLDSVSIVGARLGATLAAKVSIDRDDIDNLVFLDPVINGQDYLHKLQETHQSMLCDPDRFSTARTIDESFPNELVGFTFSNRFMEDVNTLTDIDLMKAKCANLYLINSSNCDLIEELPKAEIKSANEVIYSQFDTTICWSDISQIETTIALQGIISHITNKLTK